MSAITFPCNSKKIKDKNNKTRERTEKCKNELVSNECSRVS